MITGNRQVVRFEDLGTRGYQEVWDYQEQLLRENVSVKSILNGYSPAADSASKGAEDGTVLTALPATQHHLLFVEHPPVLTLGKSGKVEHLLLSEEQLQAKGIQFYRINRGGDITFHGPDQLVGYPILDLEKFYTDIGKYLRNLEEVIILTMAEYGLKGERSPGETGVWLDVGIPGKARKICAMGIRCSRWVTMHGFALNVNTDLQYFNYIIPCGIQFKQVTSLAKEVGHPLDMDTVKKQVKANFEKVFEVDLQESQTI